MSLVTGRIALGAAGLAAAAFGGWHLVENGRLVAVLVWLVAAVAVHDGIVAPATLVVTATAARFVRGRARRPVLVAFVLLGTVTATAVPVLGGWGRRADNPTLLDRHYLLGWWAFAAVVVLGTSLGGVLGRVRRGPSREGSS
jgi:hypothetical protein